MTEKRTQYDKELVDIYEAGKGLKLLTPLQRG